MVGDKSKPCSRFFRWIDHFWDGSERTTKKGKIRVPCGGTDKRCERRWRRRSGRQRMCTDTMPYVIGAGCADQEEYRIGVAD